LLHLIFTVLRGPIGQPSLDLRLKMSSADLKLLRCLVGSCDRLGILHYPSILSKYQWTGPPGYIWVCIEEVKRFNLALYKFCNVVDGAGESLSGKDGKTSSLLRLSQLQFPFKQNDRLWKATNMEEWMSAEEDLTREDLVIYSTEQNWISHSTTLLHSLELL
jgi:hypothetical protein